MKWESLQAASGHFGITGADLRRVRDVEIKINQGAKPGKGGRLAGAKVTPTVSKARNIPVGTDALSPDPKHDIYSIEDMPAEVWLWLLYHNHCGIKITGSNYTRYVAAGMWSQLRRRLPAGRRRHRRLGQLPRRLLARRLARRLPHHPAHPSRAHERARRPGRQRRAARHPRPQRRALRRAAAAPGCLRQRRPARRAGHAQGADRRGGRPAGGQHRQGGGLRLQPVRQLPPRLPARRHHDQAGADGPERPRPHAPAASATGRRSTWSSWRC